MAAQAALTITTLDLINLTGSIASIILSGLAIILAVLFYFGSKNAEKNTEVAVNRISDTTNTLNTVAMKMLNRLTTALVSPRPNDEKLTDIIREVRKNGFLDLPDEAGTWTKAQTEQFRVDNLIAALYYCGLTNIASQYHLPSTIGGTESDDAVANVVDQSKNDYDVLLSLIHGAQDSNKKIQSSPVKHMYDLAISWTDQVKSSREYYAAREKEEQAV